MAMGSAMQPAQHSPEQPPSSELPSSSIPELVVKLPDDTEVFLIRGNEKDVIAFANQPAFSFKHLRHQASLVLSAVGTEHETKHPHPWYDVLEVSLPQQGGDAQNSITRTLASRQPS